MAEDARLTRVAVRALTPCPGTIGVTRVSVRTLTPTYVPLQVTRVAVRAITNLSIPARVTRSCVRVIYAERIDTKEFDIRGTGTLTHPLVPSIRRRIRRLRQTPHLSAEEANLFYSRFELDLEAGVGLMSGQGVRPKVMLQWSNDHGHTWSNEQWIECGPLGQFAWRAIWRRMGRARDMVFRVVISDPIPVTLVDATVEVSRGTS